jgi:hypothetical protein
VQRIGHHACVSEVASRIIAAEAKRALLPLGVVRKGRSRSWIDDHGWWLINIEFQPSSHRKGCYLNVGEQHLWVFRNHLAFETVERPLGGSVFIDFDGDEDAFTDSMRPMVEAAAASIERRRVEHGDGRAALRRIAEAEEDLNAGIALALLGEKNSARRRLTGHVHDAFRECASSYLGLDVQRAQECAQATIRDTREALHLPPSARRPGAHNCRWRGWVGENAPVNLGRVARWVGVVLLAIAIFFAAAFVFWLVVIDSGPDVLR